MSRPWSVKCWFGLLRNMGSFLLEAASMPYVSRRSSIGGRGFVARGRTSRTADKVVASETANPEDFVPGATDETSASYTSEAEGEVNASDQE